jgi:hypothetical protein
MPGCDHEHLKTLVPLTGTKKDAVSCTLKLTYYLLKKDEKW